MGPGCVRNSRYMKMMEWALHCCCLTWKDQDRPAVCLLWDIGSGKLREHCGHLEGRDACLELVLVHVVGVESASCHLSRCLPRAYAILSSQQCASEVLQTVPIALPIFCLGSWWSMAPGLWYWSDFSLLSSMVCQDGFLSYCLPVLCEASGAGCLCLLRRFWL